MFKCDLCKNTTNNGQPINRFISQRRERSYEFPGRKAHHNPRVSHGWEIVKEQKLCPDCFSSVSGEEPIIVEKRKVKPTFKNRPFSDRAPRNKNKHSQYKRPKVEVVKTLAKK